MLKMESRSGLGDGSVVLVAKRIKGPMDLILRCIMEVLLATVVGNEFTPNLHWYGSDVIVVWVHASASGPATVSTNRKG